jgi:hypothetical protein
MNRKTVHTTSRAESMNIAALKIQCMIRIYFAKKKVERVSREAWGRVFEPKVKMYFWYNSVTGVSTWDNPRGLVLFTKEDNEVSPCENSLYPKIIHTSTPGSDTDTAHCKRVYLQEKSPRSS